MNSAPERGAEGSSKLGAEIIPFPRSPRNRTPWQRCCWVMLSDHDRQELARQRAQLYAAAGCGEVVQT